MAATPELSYGGVHLGVFSEGSKLNLFFAEALAHAYPDAYDWHEKTAQWIEHNVSPAEVYEFAYRSTWPGTNIGLTFMPWVPSRPIRIGSLWWPVGACRWSTAHFLATGEQVDELLPLAYNAASPWQPNALTLKMDTGKDNQSIEPKMYLLPPRPLARVGDYVQPLAGPQNKNRLYLLTLVDERFYWWHRNTGDFVVEAGVTTWPQLFTNIALKLGITLAQDTPAANYGKPHAYSAMAKLYEPIPLMFDAAAINCGMRVVRALNGSVAVQKLSTSKTRRDANIDALELANARQAGDWFDFGRDLVGVLPEKVRCTFVRWLNGQDPIEPPQWPRTYFWSETVDLDTLTGFSNYTGYVGAEKLFHCKMPANCRATNDVPYNAASLRGLAFQIATDFYGYQKESYLDRVYASVAAWEPEGLHDIEWTWRRDRLNTSVQRPPWNLDPEEMLQSDGSEVLPYTEWIVVRVNGSNCAAGKFGWVEQRAKIVSSNWEGEWEVLPGGRTGTPTRDPMFHLEKMNYQGGPLVADGTIVWMKKIYKGNGETRYAFICSAGKTGSEHKIVDWECDPVSGRGEKLMRWHHYRNGQYVRDSCPNPTPTSPCGPCSGLAPAGDSMASSSLTFGAAARFGLVLAALTAAGWTFL